MRKHFHGRNISLFSTSLFSFLARSFLWILLDIKQTLDGRSLHKISRIFTNKRYWIADSPVTSASRHLGAWIRHAIKPIRKDTADRCLQKTNARSYWYTR
ncbi:hypothetical protein F5B22DRAFT_167441 [Xylaria bambusicola]|uniref:uncharacterized protein n=1 Tax=Xylaria bambusicola TaxID=326684 RepID=UPI00200882C6|nr:uncharacterized protein F5B22DRAFT_167441 [Xylaria bambusicola]KAI0526602.1 hypothetical protein F5B22DRAFT_167441 [Xylaria bambusicola]